MLKYTDCFFVNLHLFGLSFVFNILVSSLSEGLWKTVSFQLFSPEDLRHL